MMFPMDHLMHHTSVLQAALAFSVPRSLQRPGRASHAPELAFEPHLQILRRHRRPLLLRLEHPHRSAVEDHVHCLPRLGSRRSLFMRIGISQVKATLALCEMALCDRTNTHFYLMSGQCLPIKTDDE